MVFCHKLNSKEGEVVSFSVPKVFSENANKISNFLFSPSILYHCSPPLGQRDPCHRFSWFALPDVGCCNDPKEGNASWVS